MAKFCTKCGSPVEEALKFCPKCGNALAQATAPSSAATPPPSAPVPATPVAATPVAGAPAPAGPVVAAAPAKSGSPILKIVLAVVGVIVLISLLGVGACIFGIYKARQKVRQFEQTAKITHSFGTPEVTSEKDEKSPGQTPAAIPDDLTYPGATATESGGSMSFGGIGVSGQEYETPDPVSTVVAFYRGKFGSKAMLQEMNGRTQFTVTGSNGITTVIIQREESAEKTKISISSIKK